jgi:hypothetical protein
LSGILIIVAAVVYYNHEQSKKTALPTEAVIIDIQHYKDANSNSPRRLTRRGANRYTGDNMRHKAFIAYDVSGKHYEAELDTYNNSMQVGDTVTIYYQPDNPQKFTSGVGSFWGIVLPFGFGVLLLLSGLPFMFIYLRKKRRRERAMMSNEIIQADIIKVRPDTSQIGMAAHLYFIEAAAVNPLNHERYIFKSEKIDRDVTPILNEHGITTISVHVDPNDYRNYWVKTDEVTHYIGN